MSGGVEGVTGANGGGRNEGKWGIAGNGVALGNGGVLWKLGKLSDDRG